MQGRPRPPQIQRLFKRVSVRAEVVSRMSLQYSVLMNRRRSLPQRSHELPPTGEQSNGISAMGMSILNKFGRSACWYRGLRISPHFSPEVSLATPARFLGAGFLVKEGREAGCVSRGIAGVAFQRGVPVFRDTSPLGSRRETWRLSREVFFSSAGWPTRQRREVSKGRRPSSRCRCGAR